MPFVALGVGAWLAVAAFVLAICRAAGRADERMEALIARERVERREVGYCGSCGGPILFDPVASHAVCPCGDCRIPRRFMRPGAEA
jgi:hypothetical protein